MSRQVRVSQNQITDSKSFSVPLHLFVWVTVGSTLEWFHQKLNSCLTGLICLHYWGKKKKRCVSTFSTFFIETQICVVSILQPTKMRTLSYSKHCPLNCVVGLSVSRLFFFFFVAKQHLRLTARPPWVSMESRMCSSAQPLFRMTPDEHAVLLFGISGSLGCKFSAEMFKLASRLKR